jgi:hypothetical protein
VSKGTVYGSVEMSQLKWEGRYKGTPSGGEKHPHTLLERHASLIVLWREGERKK